MFAIDRVAAPSCIERDNDSQKHDSLAFRVRRYVSVATSYRSVALSFSHITQRVRYIESDRRPSATLPLPISCDFNNVGLRDGQYV
jgi:hypothetical protein